jgi:3-oxoacyl-(acyl-carrier-protein) synthase
MQRQVVVTGIGVVSSPGAGKDRFWAGLVSGKSFIRPLTRFDSSGIRVHIASEIDDAILRPYLNPERPEIENRILLYAGIATQLAIEDSRFSPDDLPAHRRGIVLGTSTGPTPMAVAEYYLEGKRRAPLPEGAERSASWMSGFPAHVVRMMGLKHGFQGYSNVVSTGCAAGADAVGLATEAISWGLSDVMMAIGAEAPIELHTILAFDSIRALSHRNEDPAHASRPFDRERDGFVIGEGAAVLMLEEKGHALLRGANIYGEIRGYATTTDANHVTAPREDLLKATLAVQRALDLGGVRPEEVDYVSAHATSTPIGDRLETQLVKNVLGRRAYQVPVSSLKSIIGHSSGAAGALQAAANCMILEHQVIFPTVNLECPDPECDLDYVPNEARPARVNCILQQSFGFSGKNSILVLSRA